MKRLIKISTLLMIVLMLFSCACAGQAEVQAPGRDGTAEEGIAGESAGSVRILFANVHKADAALVLTGDAAFLIDTGTAESVPLLLGAMKCLGIRELDGVFLSHTHKDHIGGLMQICSAYPVYTVYRAAISENKKNGTNAIDTAAGDAGVPVSLLSFGDSLQLGNVTIEVLGPTVYNPDDDNDNSLVLMLNANGRRILMAGDMQFPEEEELLSGGVDLKADILKVGNHGNPDATGTRFAEAVDPELSVISTDTAIDFDSANPRVLAALSGSEILKTEGTDIGILITVTQEGSIEIAYPERPDTNVHAEIVSADREKQTVVIRNPGPDDADLSDWMLLSERKGAMVRFPEGAVLESGSEWTVSGYGLGGTYSFSEKDDPFSKKKQDRFLLYDRYGNRMSEMLLEEAE